MFKSRKSIPLFRALYALLLLLCVIRISTWLAFAIEILTTKVNPFERVEYQTFYSKLLLTFRCAPEGVFLICFFILLWSVQVLFHVCYLKVNQLNEDKSLPRNIAYSHTLSLSHPRVTTINLSLLLFERKLSNSLALPCLSFWFWRWWRARPHSRLYIGSLTSCLPRLMSGPTRF